MRQHTHHDLVYYTFDSFPEDKVVQGIFGRTGGVSPQPWASLNLSISTGDSVENAQANRRRAFDALDLPFESMADVWQVHSTDTIRMDEPRGTKEVVKADGLITDQQGVTLFQRFADCVPIFLYDPAHRAVAIVHSGWRGTVQRAAVSPVRAMIDAYGTHPADLLAGIGPSIGPDHYEVGPEVVAAARETFGAKADGLGLIQTRDQKSYFDLWAANALALQEAGVEQIETAQVCTACHTEHFFSHRAEAGKTGRFGAVLALRS